MHRLVTLAAGAALCVGLLGFGAGMVTAAREARTPPIGATTIAFDGNQVLFDNVVRAWVQTGSSSPNCLMTLADAYWWNNGNLSGFTTTTFCSGRSYRGGGVLVTIHLPEVPPPGSDWNIAYTIYQQGAKGYAPPILCQPDGSPGDCY